MKSAFFRSISVIFILVMLAGALASCGENRYYKFSRDLEPLTDEQIEECNAAYRDEYFGSYDEYVASKSEDMRAQAEKIYYGMKLIQNNVYTPYLGTVSGAIVCGTTMNTETETYVLGNHTLDTGSLKKITVYKDGKLASISQAYNSGWITDADVQIIVDRIAQYHASFEK
jgi:hypothetical protein